MSILAIVLDVLSELTEESTRTFHELRAGSGDREDGRHSDGLGATRRPAARVRLLLDSHALVWTIVIGSKPRP